MATLRDNFVSDFYRSIQCIRSEKDLDMFISIIRNGNKLSLHSMYDFTEKKKKDWIKEMVDLGAISFKDDGDITIQNKVLAHIAQIALGGTRRAMEISDVNHSIKLVQETIDSTLFKINEKSSAANVNAKAIDEITELTKTLSESFNRLKQLSEKVEILKRDSFLNF